MKKDKIILVLLLIILVSVGGILIYLSVKKEKTELEKTDAILMKEEYEILNNEINETNQKKYPLVMLDDDNPFKISNEEEIIKILEEGTGIIYFGFASCPWCRTLLPILAQTAKEENVGNIYYLDILKIRDVLELDDNDNPIVKEQGSNGYYKILELLDKQLDTYYLKNKEGKQIDTKEKRVYAPTLIAVLNGEVTAIHVGTVESQKSGYDALTANEQKQLQEILQNLLNSLNKNVCQNEGC